MTDKVVVKADELLKPNWAQYVGAALPSVFETIEYEPSDEQMAFHTDPHRVRLVAGGIRGGKSFSSAMDLVARASYTSWLNAKNGVDGFSQLYWIVGPDYEQTREEFRYIEEAFEKCGYTLVSKPSKPEGKSASWTMKWLEVGTITTKTSADISKLASVPPDGIIMSEAAQQEYGAYLACRSRIIEKAGWLIMSGTFEGSLGWYPDNYLAWQKGLRENKSFSIPTWANRKVFPGGRQDKEIVNIEAEMPADLFMERFGAVPFKPHTLVFRDFTHERNVREDCVYTPGKPVEIWIDSGYDPGYYHVSAMQFHRGEKGMEVAWQIDEIHVQRLTAPEVIEIAKSKPWWGDVVDGVIDVAGRQHHAQKSQIEIWLELTGIYLMSNVVPILDGIERHRTMLVDPSTKLPRLFHNPENVYTIKEYSLYKRKPDKETAAISEIPLDRDNHAMKAIAYGLFHRYGPVQRMKPRKGRVAVL